MLQTDILLSNFNAALSGTLVTVGALQKKSSISCRIKKKTRVCLLRYIFKYCCLLSAKYGDLLIIGSSVLSTSLRLVLLKELRLQHS